MLLLPWVIEVTFRPGAVVKQNAPGQVAETLVPHQWE